MTKLHIIGLLFVLWVGIEYRDWRREIRHEQEKKRKRLDSIPTEPIVQKKPGHDATAEQQER